MRLTLLLDMAADGFGDRVLAGRRSGGITAAELARRSHSGAALVRERAADALVYLDVNGPAFPVALFAAARAGVPLVPLNYRLGQRQLDALLARHPKALGIAGPGALAHFERAGLDAMTADEWLEQTRAEAARPARPADGEENPVAVVIYTSGTASEPKGVLLRHENLVSYVLGSVEFASADETEAALVSVPPYHIAAVANVITNLYAGRRTLVLEAFTPDEWLRTVREEGVTSAMVVPTMLARIIDSGETGRCPPCGRCPTAAPPCRPRSSNGRCGCGPGWFRQRVRADRDQFDRRAAGPEDHRAAVDIGGPGGAGAAVLGRQAAARDRTGDPRPRRRSPRRRAGRPDLRARRPGVGGVRGPGPGGRRPRLLRHQGRRPPRPGGYLFVSGRADDTIIRGAENIAPAEIEDVLLRHPAVLDAVVFGVPDQEWGQRIEAAVVARPDTDVDPAELRDFTMRALRSSKTPDRFWLLDALPRTETGKLLRRQVPGLIATGHGTAVAAHGGEPAPSRHEKSGPEAG